jgi:hypothetical protein
VVPTPSSLRSPCGDQRYAHVRAARRPARRDRPRRRRPARPPDPCSCRTTRRPAPLRGLRGRGVGEGRPTVELVDLLCFGRPARLVWHKHRWCCPASTCPAGSWTGQDPRIGAARLAMTDRAGRWATAQVGRHGRTVNEVAGELGCDWHTVNDAVLAYGTPLVDDPDRIGEVTALRTHQARRRPHGGCLNRASSRPRAVQPRQAHRPQAAPPRSLGTRLQPSQQLPARPHGTHPPQTRTRPLPTPLLPHRTRHGLPLRHRRAMTRPGQGRR